MKAEDFVYDILEIMSMIEDDHDVDELWIINKFNQYRAIYIYQDYLRNTEINPSWLQRMLKQKVEKVTSADDPDITISSISLGKTIIPKVIGLPDDLGLYRISGSSGIVHFDPVDFNTLMLKIDIGEDMNVQYGYCSRIGNVLYTYPVQMEIQGVIIAENPFDIKINDNGVLRDMLVTDEYPMDASNAQRIILDILTNDLNLKIQTISDIVNDSQSQLKLLKNGIGTQAGNQE